jgi:hypothetical protein
MNAAAMPLARKAGDDGEEVSKDDLHLVCARRVGLDTPLRISEHDGLLKSAARHRSPRACTVAADGYSHLVTDLESTASIAGPRSPAHLPRN